LDHTSSPPNSWQGKQNSDCFATLAVSLWFLPNHSLLNFRFPTCCVMFMANEHRYNLSIISLHMTSIENDLPVNCQCDSWWWLVV
jgi:hypothetical protein